MNNQQSFPLSYAYNYQGKSMEELRCSLMYSTLELTAEEQLSRAEEELTQLKDLLNRVIRERDEAQDNFQQLFMEKLLLQKTTPYIEDEPRRVGEYSNNNGISSTDSEESIVSSLMVDPIPPLQPPLQILETEKKFPEKGKFLEAVVKAGPLLQTILLAGPLPQWRNPPPPLETYEIPPVAIPSSSSSPSTVLPPHHLLLYQDSSTISNIDGDDYGSCGSFNKKKRSLVVCQGSDSSTNTKFQRIGLH